MLDEQTGFNRVVKTFDELLSENKDYQSIHDKKVSEGIKTALKTEKFKWHHEQEKRISELTSKFNITELVSETEGLDYYYDKLAEYLDRITKENNSYKLKEDAINIARSKNMDLDLLNILDFSNMSKEQLESNIDWIVNCFNKSLEKRINLDVLSEDEMSNKIITIGDKKYKIASVGINWVDIEERV